MLNLVSTCYSRRHRRHAGHRASATSARSLSFWLNTCKSSANEFSHVSSNSLTANHRTLMFRSADFCDLHVTLNIQFLQRAPCSMRNLEARLRLSHHEACGNGGASRRGHDGLSILPKSAETSKRSPKLISTWGQYTRHDSWNSGCPRGRRPTSGARESIFHTPSTTFVALSLFFTTYRSYTTCTDRPLTVVPFRKKPQPRGINSRSAADQLVVAVGATQ